MWPDEVTAAAKHALRKAGVTGNSLKALRMSLSDARKINDHMGGRLCELCGRSFLPELHHYVLIFFFFFPDLPFYYFYLTPSPLSLPSPLICPTSFRVCLPPTLSVHIFLQH